MIRLYEEKLNSSIDSFIVDFKKRYMKFPWKLVNKVPNSKDNKVVTVAGNKYTVKTLKKEVSQINRNLKLKLKPSAYKKFINAFKSEAKFAIKKDKDVSAVYRSIQSSLDADFKNSRDDLKFCLEAMRQLIQYLKDRDTIVNESFFEEYEKDNTIKSIYESEDNIMTRIEEIVLESYRYLYDTEDIFEEDVTTEGANLNMREIFKGYKKDYKKHLKNFKAYVKAKEYDSAKSELAKSKEIISKAMKDISEYEADDVGSMIFSWITAFTVDFGHTFLITLEAYSGILAPLAIYESIKDNLNRVRGIEKAAILKGKTSSAPEAFNGYKQEILKVLMRYTKALEACEKNLNALKSRDAKAKMTKESEDLQEQILGLYTLCEQGVITVEEREEMALELREAFNEQVEENDKVLEEEVQADMSKQERFIKVKKSLYEKCSNGIITESQREKLINAAYDRIFETGSEMNDPQAVKTANTLEPSNQELEKAQKDAEAQADKAAKDTQNAQ